MAIWNRFLISQKGIRTLQGASSYETNGTSSEKWVMNAKRQEGDSHEMPLENLWREDGFQRTTRKTFGSTAIALRLSMPFLRFLQFSFTKVLLSWLDGKWTPKWSLSIAEIYHNITITEEHAKMMLSAKVLFMHSRQTWLKINQSELENHILGFVSSPQKG